MGRYLVFRFKRSFPSSSAFRHDVAREGHVSFLYRNGDNPYYVTDDRHVGSKKLLKGARCLSFHVRRQTAGRFVFRLRARHVVVVFSNRFKSVFRFAKCADGALLYQVEGRPYVNSRFQDDFYRIRHEGFLLNGNCARLGGVMRVVDSGCRICQRLLTIHHSGRHAFHSFGGTVVEWDRSIFKCGGSIPNIRRLVVLIVDRRERGYTFHLLRPFENLYRTSLCRGRGRRE